MSHPVASSLVGAAMTFAPADGSALRTLPARSNGDLASTVRYFASQKNVSLSPQQVDVAVTWVSNCLADSNIARIDFGTDSLTDPVIKVIDRILDVLAAKAVMRYVVELIEGQLSVDPNALLQRASQEADRFTGGVPFFRWPDPKETFSLHYGDIAWAPITATSDDGTTTTYYMRNWHLHRSPPDGPALHRKSQHGQQSEYWVQGKPHRPSAEGPAMTSENIAGDSAIRVAFYENGLLHRDPACGPALRTVNLEGSGLSVEEFRVNGELHRPTALGPAIAVTNRDGQRVFEAYMENGKLHRDTKEGPALHDRLPQTGERIEYYATGKLHRDPFDGPAVVHGEPDTGIVRLAIYMVHGEPHRADGPSDTARDDHGRITSEGWWLNGVMHRDPAAGPALVHENPETGEVRTEYVYEGVLHRDPKYGPAVFIRDNAGDIIEQQYWFEGNRIETPEALSTRHARRAANSISARVASGRGHKGKSRARRKVNRG